jgi:branched-subunit amino acid aminotransferase/4-amino-4-deoxychorismate lyase
MTRRVLFDGRIVPAPAARVPYLDRAVQYGFGLFETLRIYEGVPFLLEQHLARLETSARAFGIRLPLEWKCLPANLARLIRAENARRAGLRIVVTAGAERRPRTLVAAHLFPLELPPARAYRTGVDVAIGRHISRTGGLLAGHKTLNYLEARLARARARAFEVLRLDLHGRITEGTVTNVFALIAGSVRTAPVESGILGGVTRALVIRILAQLRIPIVERAFTPRELLRASEAFLTNSLVEIVPIRSLDGTAIRAGPIAQAVLRQYRQRVREATGTHIIRRK